MKKILQYIILVVTVAAFTGCWEVSDGERSGIVTKFSHKGAIWSTWEGELHFAGANGTIVADSWEFSLDKSRHRDEDIGALVKTLTEAQLTGKRVKIKYRQEMIVIGWRAETDYLVQSVEILN